MNGVRALDRATAFWFAAVAAGQWAFIAYLAAYYVAPALRGGLPAWTGLKLTTGYIPGDAPGNFAVGAHVLLASLVLICGQLQLLPAVRLRFSRLHRWSGRVYLAGAAVVALAGLYMVWVRGDPQAGPIEHVGTSIGAVLIFAFVGLNLRSALRSDFAAHRRWALRLFMTVSGVWFIRVGYGLWFFVHGEKAIGAKAFSIFISYAQYLVPLAGLEIYFRVRKLRRQDFMRLYAGLIVALAVLTVVGVYEASIRLWLPRLQNYSVNE